MEVDFRLRGALGDVLSDWGHHAVLMAMREELLRVRREDMENDPNDMNVLDKAAARVTEAAELLTSVGI